MWRRLPALTPVAAVGAAALAEGSERWDDCNKPDYARRQLLSLRAAAQATEGEEKPENANARSWLGGETPKFPYLLAMSPGDDPDAVLGSILHGALVVGSRDQGARAMVDELTSAPTNWGRAVHSVAARWKTLKAAVHADLPDGFDPRVSSTDIGRDAVITALKQLKAQEQDDASDSQPTSSFFVFLLPDFDEFSAKEMEQWLRWTQEISTAGLGHVVTPTRKAVTTKRMQWLTERHNANCDGDFVAILLRVAKGAADKSSANEKVLKVAATLNLKLNAQEEAISAQGDDDTEYFDNSHLSSDDEASIVADAVGNWWADVDEVCKRLVKSELADTVDRAERQAVIRRVCNELVDESANLIVEQLEMDADIGELLRVRVSVRDGSHSTGDLNAPGDLSDAECRALDTLESWRCLETMTGLAGGREQVRSVQDLAKRDDHPQNCVQPIVALLPFNHRREGEQKFFKLLDQDVLLLRPKNDVEIGVIPCEPTGLVSPCWVEVRPVIKRAFEQLWRKEEYNVMIQELERLSTSLQLREEVHIFEREIEDRQQELNELRRAFDLEQYGLTSAAKAKRKAELSLVELELEAKRVYLDKLRTLLD